MHDILIDIDKEKRLLTLARKWKERVINKERGSCQKKERSANKAKIPCEICGGAYKDILKHKRSFQHIQRAENPIEEAANTNPIIQSLLNKQADERFIINSLRDQLKEQQKKNNEIIESLRSEIDALKRKSARLEEHIDSLLQ